MPADVLILGADGMFGHMAAHVVAREWSVLRAAREASAGAVAFDARGADDALEALLRNLKTNGLVVNGVAVLASDIAANLLADRERALLVNALFPLSLARVASRLGLRVVQISTDGVFPRLGGPVAEDAPIGPDDCYGLTKAAGELVEAHTLTIRCSIIGPPGPKRRRGLWAWVADQPQGAKIRGFTNQVWSGTTTHQLAQACAALADEKNFLKARREAAIHHLVPNPVASKHEIVLALARRLRPDLEIAAVEAEAAITRELRTRYTSLHAFVPRYPTWDQALAAAAEHIPANP